VPRHRPDSEHSGRETHPGGAKSSQSVRDRAGDREWAAGGRVNKLRGMAVSEEEEQEREEREEREVAARRAAALSRVRKFGDPVLKTKAAPVSQFDDTLRDEVRRMGELMIDAVGVGLAATQLGVLHRLLVYRVQQDSPVVALVNPEIEWRGSEEEIAEEGCLSLPLVLVDVERPIHVRVRALDEYGEPITIEATGLESRVIQHELDHLDGVLILDRTSRDQRKEAMRTLREALAPA
jgi:peptide deformylase